MTKPVRQSQLFDAIMDAIGVADHPAIPAAALVPQAAGPELDGAGARVLIAEDNEINRIVVTETLAKFGYRCDAVTDGAKAVDAVLKGGYDLVLMDCQMPLMDGFEATKRIRAAEAERGTGRIPIVALTANAMKGDRELCLAAGMDAYTSKPVKPVQLAATIKMLLTDGRSRETVEVTSEGDGSPLEVMSLIEQCLNNAGLVGRLLTQFEEEASKDLAEIAVGVESAQADRIVRAAHALTGAAGVMFAKDVASTASDIEALARVGNLAAVTSKLDLLRERIRRCMEFLPLARRQVEQRTGASHAGAGR